LQSRRTGRGQEGDITIVWRVSRKAGFMGLRYEKWLLIEKGMFLEQKNILGRLKLFEYSSHNVKQGPVEKWTGKVGYSVAQNITVKFGPEGLGDETRG
jgi:hypothetical protein